MNNICVKCGMCGGSGEVVLSSLFRATLNLLSVKNPCTGAELARSAGCKATAMNNRLAVLEKKYGLVKSERDGRKRLYRLSSEAMRRIVK